MANRKKTFASQLDAEELNPAMQFISPPQTARAPVQAQEAPAPRVEIPPAARAPQPPEGYRLNPMFIEKKTRRLQLLLKPSVYDRVKELADREGVSVNEYISSVLETATR